MIARLKPESERIARTRDHIPMSEGQAADVIEILIRADGDVEYRLLKLSGSSFIAPATSFVIIDSTVPIGWTVIARDYGGVDVTFPEFAAAGFWEEYFDGDANAVRVHDEVLARALPKS